MNYEPSKETKATTAALVARHRAWLARQPHNLATTHTELAIGGTEIEG